VAAESWATVKDLLYTNMGVSLLYLGQACEQAGTRIRATGRPTSCAALLVTYDIEVESGNGTP
jgi:hypothetical protein